MKSNFALSLSFEGIRLLHRAAGGWRIVGDVALDAADMAAELAVLRRTATGLAPGGLRTKVLLPDAQVKYLTINTPDLDYHARRAAARKALEKATPYAVKDLAFDISVDGPNTHIAAVARETLAEAEEFAIEHRFNPISFATVPHSKPYLGEPFFGPSKTVQAVLKEGETVEPDGVAVVIIGEVAPQQEPVLKPAVSSTADVPAPSADAKDGQVKPDSAGEQADKKDSKASDPQETPSPEPQESIDTITADTGNTAEALVQLAKEGLASGEPASDKKPDSKGEIPAPPAFKTSSVIADVPPLAGTSASKPETTPADVAKKSAAPGASKTPKSKARDAGSIPEAPAVGSAVVPPMAKAPPVVTPDAGFASRRSDIKVPKKGTEAERREPALKTAVATSVPPAPPAVPTDFLAEPQAPSRAAAGIAAATAAAAPIGRFLSRRKSTAEPAGVQTAPAAAGAITATPSEAERMTVFGARRSDVGGKPRFLGLILTAALLVFLAGVAAWASVFLDDGLNLSRLFGDRTAREVVKAEPDTALQPENVVTASLDPTLTPEDTAVLDALRDPAPRPATQITDRELEATYAATGIWPKAPIVPPEPVGLVNIDDLYLTSIDPVSTSNDAVALPAVASFGTDLGLGKLASPAAAGTSFALDTRGLVIATAAGAISPNGFTVYLGAPPAKPPVVRARFQAVPQDDPANTALAAFRPKNRPGDLAENNERATLDGLTRRELASLRPKFRPRSVQQQVEAAAAAKAAEEAAKLAEEQAKPVDTDDAVETALAETTKAFENATRFATKASARPDTRPRNFNRIVRRAQRTPKPKAEETRVASNTVAPRVVTPKIPTKTSVARQATVKNAINLRKVNLIGVYGKPSNRRALVRLGNGRYKKVTVGDRIDGGRISAISNSELRYTKSGRNVVLRMP